MRKLVCLFLLLLFSASVAAVIEKDSLKIFAVTEQGNALSADLTLEIKPGSGNVWSSVEPLVGTSTQTTEKLAVQIAKNYSKEVGSFDYFFGIKSDASLVEGPSAGAAMTLLTISMLQDRKVPDYVGLTGTITPDGSVGSVGGVFEKSKEAAKIGMKLFMIPAGEAKQTVKLPEGVKSINLSSYAKEQWSLLVVEVKDIDDVLHFAFADLESIDVNAEETVLPDFVPNAISFNRQLQPMDSIVRKFIAEADEGINGARSALSGTLLNDPAVVDVLLQQLSSSEKMLAEAKILADQNYLYSAGNDAFLSIVYSAFVRDIADEPQLINPTSTSLDSKAGELSRQINSLAFDLNRFIAIDQFEWHVAAKQRLSWAKLNIDKLLAKDEIIITIDGSAIDEQRLSDLLDYQFAVAWYNAAEDFFDITKSSTKRIQADRHFADAVESNIAAAEKNLAELPVADTEDIVRRLDASKLEKEQGWFEAALFDSASALGLTDAQLLIKGKSLDELRAELEQKISELEVKMHESNQKFVWASLYLDHARFFLQSADFYLQNGQSSRAVESAGSGIALAFMAESAFDSAEQAGQYFATLPESAFLPGPFIEPFDASKLYPFIALFIVLGAVVALILLFAVLSTRVSRLRHASLKGEISRIRFEQKRLHRMLSAGQISGERCKKLDSLYQKRLRELLDESEQLSSTFVELDLSKSKLFAFERTVKRLKQQSRKGEITKKDFTATMQFCEKRINALTKEISAEIQRLQLEKKAIKKSVAVTEKENSGIRKGKIKE